MRPWPACLVASALPSLRRLWSCGCPQQSFACACHLSDRVGQQSVLYATAYIHVCNATLGRLEADEKRAESESGAHAREGLGAGDGTMAWRVWSRDKGFCAYCWLAMILAWAWCILASGSKGALLRIVVVFRGHRRVLAN